MRYQLLSLLQQLQCQKYNQLPKLFLITYKKKKKKQYFYVYLLNLHATFNHYNTDIIVVVKRRALHYFM